MTTSSESFQNSRSVQLSPQEQRVVSLAEQDPLLFATSTAAAIASLTSTSEATVARTAKKLGHPGTKAMKKAYANQVERSRDLGDVIQNRLDSLGGKTDTTGVPTTGRLVLTSAAELLLELNECLDHELVRVTVDRITTSRRTAVFGLGTAHAIAQYMALELERVGLDALSLNGAGHSLADALPRVRAEDHVVILAPLTVFPDIRHFMEEAADRGAVLTLISQDDPPALSTTIGHFRLPGTSQGSASESVAAWTLVDVLIAEIARRDPGRAIAARNYVQDLRRRFSPRS